MTRDEQILKAIEYCKTNGYEDAEYWLRDAMPFLEVTRQYKLEKHKGQGNDNRTVFRVQSYYPNVDGGPFMPQSYVEMPVSEYQSETDALFHGIATLAASESNYKEKNTCRPSLH